MIRRRSGLSAAIVVVGVATVLLAPGTASAGPRCSHNNHTHSHTHSNGSNHTHHWDYVGYINDASGHHELFKFREGGYYRSSRSCTSSAAATDNSTGSLADSMIDLVLDPFIETDPAAF